VAWSQTTRNLLAMLTVASVYVGVWIGPESNLAHAVLDCSERGGDTQIFPDMTACAGAQVGESRYCPCYRPPNPVAFPYYSVFIPLAFAALGYLLPKGPWGIKTILLSASMLFGGIVLPLTTDMEAEGIAFWYLYVFQLVVSANLVLALLVFGRRFVRGSLGAA
jgi:hypothetical protein